MKIDLSKLPEGTKWIAIDSDGEVYAYSDEPRKMLCGSDVVYSDSNNSSLGIIGNVHD